MRKHSFLDDTNCRQYSTKYRNLTMFICVGVTFMVLPVLLLAEAFVISWSSESTESLDVADTPVADPLRMLHEEHMFG